MHCFNEVVVQIPQPNEDMCVKAFIRGLRLGAFSESLVKKRSTYIVECEAMTNWVGLTRHNF